MPVTTTDGIAHWQNWSGRQTANPAEVARPVSEDDLVAAVGLAAERGVPLRAVGASHSHSRVAVTDGVLVETDHWQGLVSVDSENRRATIRSGTRIFQLGPLLFEHGLALRNQGDIDKQSIAGATATGTHGTGPTLQNFSAAVVDVRLVGANGTLLDLSPADPLFAAARQGLGAFGLISEVTLGLRDAYRLHERLWSEAPDDVFARIDELIAATRHFEFFWVPEKDVCACKSLDETEAPPDPMEDNKLERIGWSHEIISSIRDDRHTEMEYSLPAEAGPACFGEIRRLIQSEFTDLEWPVEYRTLAPDDGWISTTAGQPTVTISVHQDIALDDRPLFQACEQVFLDFGGRPHWGKVHYRSGDDLAALYPRWTQWWDLRDVVDPEGVFLTPYLESLRPH